MLAEARLQALDKLIQREVLFQRAEKEKLLPTEEEMIGPSRPRSRKVV